MGLLLLKHNDDVIWLFELSFGNKRLKILPFFGGHDDKSVFFNYLIVFDQTNLKVIFGINLKLNQCVKLKLQILVIWFEDLFIVGIIQRFFLDLDHEKQIVVRWKWFHLLFNSLLLLLVFYLSNWAEHRLLCEFKSIIFFLLDIVTISR